MHQRADDGSWLLVNGRRIGAPEERAVRHRAQFGHRRSESLHLTGRFRRRDCGHMDIGVTVDDPEIYTTTFSIQVKAVAADLIEANPTAST